MATAEFEVRYSWAERVVHRLAFAGPAVQMAANDFEDKLFHNQFSDANYQNPVFVTSLARAGTTLVLQLLSQHPELASHTYRDMPFVLAPFVWDRIFGRARRDGETRERAHGDGVQIGFNSPESFEEVFWKSFWPKHYHNADQILLWKPEDQNAEAVVFFRKHMQKIVALRRPQHKDAVRYVSKNNANIARIDLLAEMLPDAKIVVVIRNPLEHAASLLRQHKNFAEQQAKDAFVAKYMADIGHFEFGMLHRPFGFSGLPTDLPIKSPNYWLTYWLAAFRYVEERSDKVHILPYEALCRNPDAVLYQFCDALDLQPEGLLDVRGLVRQPQHSASLAQFSPELVDQSTAVYHSLLERSNYSMHF